MQPFTAHMLLQAAHGLPASDLLSGAGSSNPPQSRRAFISHPRAELSYIDATLLIAKDGWQVARQRGNHLILQFSVSQRAVYLLIRSTTGAGSSNP